MQSIYTRDTVPIKACSVLSVLHMHQKHSLQQRQDELGCSALNRPCRPDGNRFVFLCMAILCTCQYSLSPYNILTLLYFFSCEVDAQNRYTSLYNKRVVSARKMNRPLGSSGGSLGHGLPHSGVIVTLEDRSTWLVHKGKMHIIKMPPF